MNAKVDAYLGRAKKWRAEMEKLRAIVLGCGLDEELKWGKPCYTFGGRNVVLILPFKEHCALLFGKGALLKDGKGILVRPTENTQAARQMRFAGAAEIASMERTVSAYVREAIEVEKAGLEVEFKDPSDFPMPAELQRKLDGSPALKSAFEALTPGRQRGYYLHFSAAKQSKTREARIDKCTPRILAGKGLNDR